MTELVPADHIEQIVGRRRHREFHYGRADTTELTFYILHSAACRDSGLDLRECPYSLVLDQGIDPDDFTPDAPLLLVIERGALTEVLAEPDVQRCPNCGKQWTPVQRMQCLYCGDDSGPAT